MLPVKVAYYYSITPRIHTTITAQKKKKLVHMKLALKMFRTELKASLKALMCHVYVAYIQEIFQLSHSKLYIVA